jgi:hypothetical protein
MYRLYGSKLCVVVSWLVNRPKGAFEMVGLHEWMLRVKLDEPREQTTVVLLHQFAGEVQTPIAGQVSESVAASLG